MSRERSAEWKESTEGLRRKVPLKSAEGAVAGGTLGGRGLWGGCRSRLGAPPRPGDRLPAGRGCGAAWVRAFLCFCLCRPCRARPVFVTRGDGEHLDVRLLTEAQKWRPPEAGSFPTDRCHRRGVASCQEGTARGLGSVRWFVRPGLGFKGWWLASQSQSHAFLVCSRLQFGFLLGFVVLFRSELSCSVQSLAPWTSQAESTVLLILLRCFTAVVAVITRLLHFG